MFTWGGGGYGRTCATRDDEPRPVWTSLPITHLLLLCVCVTAVVFVHELKPQKKTYGLKAPCSQHAAVRPGRLYLAAGRAHRRIRWRASYRALPSSFSDMCPGLSVVAEGSKHWATHACVVSHVE
jgi:hypothetical protein